MPEPETNSSVIVTTPEQEANLRLDRERERAALEMGGGFPKLPDAQEPVAKKHSSKLKPNNTVPSRKLEWMDVPQYPNQIIDTDAVRQIHQESYYLDLAKPEDLKMLNVLQNLEFDPKSSRYILNQERRFDDKNGRFIAFVDVGTFQFREFIKDSKK